jgi:cbb3-type cytochrome oxidase subunit 3
LDKDCELQKVGAFRSYLEANINAQFSFLAGGLIGILVLVVTLFYEGIFDVFGGRFLGLIPFVIVLIGVFYAFSRILRSIKDQETRNLSLIFDLISKVEKGEPIPSLTELKQKTVKKNKAL